MNSSLKFQFLFLVLTFLKVTSVLSYNSKILNDPKCIGEEKKSKCHCTDTVVHDESECNLRLCGADRMCRQYHQIEKHIEEYRINGTFEIRNVTGLSKQRLLTDNKTVEYTDIYDFSHVDGRKCGNKTKWDQFRRDFANETSFSPWQFVINHDANRKPQDILETQCICHNCLNATRTGTSKYYVTDAFKVTRYFQHKLHGSDDNQIFNAEFGYGCFCEFNNALVPTS